MSDQHMIWDGVSDEDEDERGLSTTETATGSREMVTVSESGLYSLIFKSRKPNAAHFRKWVTSVVLPAIRTEGAYQPAPPPAPAKHDASKVRLISEARQVFGTRAAGELWFTLGLPIVAAMKVSPVQSDLFLTWSPPHSGDQPAAI